MGDLSDRTACCRKTYLGCDCRLQNPRPNPSGSSALSRILRAMKVERNRLSMSILGRRVHRHFADREKLLVEKVYPNLYSFSFRLLYPVHLRAWPFSTILKTACKGTHFEAKMNLQPRIQASGRKACGMCTRRSGGPVTMEIKSKRRSPSIPRASA